MSLKNSAIIFLLVCVYSCTRTGKNDTATYFSFINEAELLICRNQFGKALNAYQSAFDCIQKPFGKDLFNAALCGQLSQQFSSRNDYLQIIINNSVELDFVESQFLGPYLTRKEWRLLITNQQRDYDPILRNEIALIHQRDQLFRPQYETHDDTINANRKINLTRILSIADSIGFPSHIELGFAGALRGQQLDIVLHHTAQRRSRDKSVLDLEGILHKAVNEGRFDPESAILYMSYQNDLEKGNFEVYPITQLKHYLLPDSLNNKIWVPILSEEHVDQANLTRAQWHANSLEDIATKARYLSSSTLPFIFTSVKKSIVNLRTDFDKAQALEQYNMATRYMREYKQ